MSESAFLSSINQVPASEWNALAPEGYPFLRHEFLAALENSGSTGADSGWQAHHLILRDTHGLQCAMPCYLKDHSWGEYVFDWSWAEAYQRNRIPYYPKLLSAIPFTPASGPRLLLAPGADPAVLAPRIHALISAELQRLGASSWHLLFPEAALADAFVTAGMLRRTGVQFHWINRGYRDFDDFLAQLVARKRKSLRRERREVQEQGLVIHALRGTGVDAALWDRFYLFYQMTYARRSGHGGYLSHEFFRQLGAAMPEKLLLVIAERDGELVAGALNIIGSDTLYGRYWGCTEEYRQLHFELCYYQGIEFCIREGLQRFDAGAQGEHKLTRGFEPVITESCHLIAHPGFGAAIEDFLQRERQAIAVYRDDAERALPYRQDVPER